MSHTRTKRKPNAKNLGRLIFSVIVVFVLMMIILSIGNIFKNKSFSITNFSKGDSINSGDAAWILQGDGLFFTKDNNQIFVQIASTGEAREQGLSGTEKLKVHKDGDRILTEGMLFVFPVASEYQFWMKDMNYDLDMIWLDDNYKIVHIEKNAKAGSYHPSDPASSKIFSNEGSMAKYVLEINAGLSDKLHLNVGDKLRMQ